MKTKNTCTKKWYEENRQLMENERGERYYDLPLASVMEIIHDIEEENNVSIDWDVVDVIKDSAWVSVKVDIYINGQKQGSLYGESPANPSPEAGDVGPIVLAQAQALKGYFKKKYSECNLPRELAEIEQDQVIAPSPEEVELPEEPKPKKTRTTKKPEETKEEKQEKTVETPKEEIKEPEKTEEHVKTEVSVDDALNHIVEVGVQSYDGKTIKEVLEMPTGAQFLKYYAQRKEHPKFEKIKEFCEIAEIVLSQYEGEIPKGKH